MSLLQMSISAALMIVAIIIVRTLTIEHLPKKTFLALWAVVLLRLLLPFSVPCALSIYSLFPALNIPPQSVENVEVISSPPSSDTVFSFERLVPFPDKIDSAAQSLLQSAEEGGFHQISWLSLLWEAGVVLMAAFFIVSYLHSTREFKMSLPIDDHDIQQWACGLPLRRTVQVRQHDRITTPLTYGILHPVILLPKQALQQDSVKLRYILTHEYTHILRLDNLTKIFLAAALCLHWFNPLVWVMYLIANRDLELACDEDVLHSLGAENRASYAYTLIDLEERKGNLSSLYSNFSKNAIEERIVSIMKMKKASFISILAALLILSTITTAFATSPEVQAKPIMKNIDEVYMEMDLSEFEIYKPYGMTYKKKEDMFYYKGKPVRFFYDSGNGISFTNFFGGEVDVEATRDSKNKLTGLHYSSKEASKRRTKEFQNTSFATSSSIQINDINSTENTIKPGTDVVILEEAKNIPSFETKYSMTSVISKGTATEVLYENTSTKNLLKNYIKFGVSYDKKNDCWRYNGKRIKTFIDNSDDHGIYYQDEDGEVLLRASYYIEKSGKKKLNKLVLMDEAQKDKFLSEMTR